MSWCKILMPGLTFTSLIAQLYIIVIFAVFLFFDFSRLNRMHGRVLEAGVFSLKFIDMYNEFV